MVTDATIPRWWRRWPRVVKLIPHAGSLSAGDLIDEAVLDVLERVLERLETLEEKETSHAG